MDADTIVTATAVNVTQIPDATAATTPSFIPGIVGSLDGKIDTEAETATLWHAEAAS